MSPPASSEAVRGGSTLPAQPQALGLVTEMERGGFSIHAHVSGFVV